MADTKSNRSNSHPVWDAFAQRHAGHPFLESDPLYALSEPLINSIKQEIPEFFTADEERFERDLARTASFGFFLHDPRGSTVQAIEQRQPTFDDRDQQLARQIKEMQTEELLRVGCDEEDVKDYFKQGADYREKIEARQNAYAGWLVLNSGYRDEVRHFRERWESAVQKVGRFPRLPMWSLPDPTDGKSLPSGFRDECYRFFYRWGLETLATWDWPLPLEPDLGIGLRRDLTLFSSGGMLLFVPWYLLRGEKLDLQEVVRRLRLASVPSHLLEWVKKRGKQKQGELDDIRYARILQLYRYDQLLLSRRYSIACKGNRQRLDRALAHVIGRDEETVRKLRQEMQRALGRIERRKSAD